MMESNNELCAAVLERLRELEPELAAGVRSRFEEVEGERIEVSSVGPEGRELQFWCVGEAIQFSFFAYWSSLSLFPRPEEAIDGFCRLIKDLWEDRKRLLMWIEAGEEEPCAELIETGQEAAYAFLWGEAPEARLVGMQPGIECVLREGAESFPDPRL